jgi:hypothetical protein
LVDRAGVGGRSKAWGAVCRNCWQARRARPLPRVLWGCRQVLLVDGSAQGPGRRGVSAAAGGPIATIACPGGTNNSCEQSRMAGWDGGRVGWRTHNSCEQSRMPERDGGRVGWGTHNSCEQSRMPRWDGGRGWMGTNNSCEQSRMPGWDGGRVLGEPTIPADRAGCWDPDRYRVRSRAGCWGEIHAV